jgi:anti-sigma B factor antagonist
MLMGVTDIRFPVDVIGGVPVVRAPEDVDIGNADGLRAALVHAASLQAVHGVLVVDMARTEFCDTAGLHALVAAHKRARAGGGQVLLVIGSGAVLRIFTITGLDRVIPHVTSLEQALARIGVAEGG